MKKNIFWLAVAAFFVAGLSLVAVVRADDNGPELEKILAPEFLKEFRVMKKEGGALYGVRLTASSTTAGLMSSGNKKSGGVFSPSTPVPGSNGVGKQLEKISSPELIKLYENIRKIDNSLWGVKKSGDKKDLTSTSTAPVVSGNDQQLEKISAPALINLYEKIKKIGNALWGVKKVEENNNILKPVVSFITVPAEISSCVQSAIEAKDQAAMTELTAVASRFNAVISERSTCQQAAVGSTSNQKLAVEECVKVFQTSREQVKKEAQQSQQETWNTYRNSLKICQKNISTSTSIISGQGEGEKEAEGELMIEDGGGSSVDTVIESGSSN
ncbi:MAG: hypothetical protein WC249_03350 [Patescibacteria group bacterium]|jgi:hypothetical protein